MSSTSFSIASSFHDLNEVLPIANAEPRFDPFADPADPICLRAVEDLQSYLLSQEDLGHDFGLVKTTEGTPIGKMFGVLLVRTKNDRLGYLAAFSGKLGGKNQHQGFVPPIYDSVDENGFLSKGMAVLRQLSDEIALTQAEERKDELMVKRAKTSAALQSRLFDQYSFTNEEGRQKNLRQIFNKELGKNPPTAAGECAAPKLLQFAFDHDLKPIALAEFWWGASTRSAEMVHGHFYPPCEDKCRPILNHMLS